MMILAVMNHDTPSHNAHPLGLDGTHENDASVPHQNSDRGHVTHHCEPHAVKEPSVHSATTLQNDSARRESCPPEANEADDGTYRRKRRRISVDPDQQSTGTQNEANSTQKTWVDQLQAAARACVGGDLEGGGFKAEMTNNQGTLSNTDSLKDGSHAVTSARIDPRLLESIAHPVASVDIPSTTEQVGAQPPHQDGPVTDLPIDKPLSLQTVATSTPQKKRMMLNGNGKLVSSPKRSPLRSPRAGKQDKDGERKAGTRSKKIEMRNGKFVSSLRISLPYKSTASGNKIDEILSGQVQGTYTSASQPEPAFSGPPESKGTHPFFLGKLAPKGNRSSELKSEASSTAPASEDEAISNYKPLKPWKEIMFGTKRSFRKNLTARQPAIWPPTSLQHVQPNQEFRVTLPMQPSSSSAAKSKQRDSAVTSEDDILQNFSRCLGRMVFQSESLHIPIRTVMSGKELCRRIDFEIRGGFGDSTIRLPPTPFLESRVQFTSSAFDRGLAAGPYMWPQEYAPKCWQEVLQNQSQVLHDWLDNLRVHNVQSGKMQPRLKLAPKKQRRKRKSDEMDDFIAQSDEEDDDVNAPGKNAILIAGPAGCGKTASVFAVAKQLGFEVFEIHSGMRRNAKDIQDRVGDMTQNHLVQQSDVLSRRSSVSLDRLSPSPDPAAANQNIMARFMGMGKQAQQQKVTEPKEIKESKAKLQKQSLILFEEVDVLFEDDKGFWSGVQSLIRTSKRPVIMTCNDLRSVPLEDLDLFAVLNYERPGTESAVKMLELIAGAEGHLLCKQAVQNLYLSKGRDFRASLNELNLWCQMTIGSQKGGLDWMLPYDEKQKANPDGSVTRIVSQDTFISGLDLLPTEFDDHEELFRFTAQELGISPLDWVKDDSYLRSAHDNGVQAIDDMLILSDSRSAMDLLDPSNAALLANVTKQVSGSSFRSLQRDDVVRLYLDQMNDARLTRAHIGEALEALTEERRIGLPMSPGRRAPSLDNDAISVVTEVAPYVRAIISQEQALQQLRDELHGGSEPKRQRKTRASRAALEGGSKVSTRRDKWFPESLDFASVLATGNGWPQSRMDDETPSATGTPASSMAVGADSDASQTRDDSFTG